LPISDGVLGITRTTRIGWPPAIFADGTPAIILTTKASDLSAPLISGQTEGKICGLTESTTTSACATAAGLSDEVSTPYLSSNNFRRSSEMSVTQTSPAATTCLSTIPATMASAMFPAPINVICIISPPAHKFA
jgi:hypothetical protein